VYPVRAGLPRSSYFEYTCLLAQSLAINCILRLFTGVSPVTVTATAASYIAALAVVLRTLPLPLAKMCAPAATALLSMSLVPQIARNFASQTASGWSPVTAGLALIGNGIRIFTTIKLASSDSLLLGQFGLGALLNGMLLAQMAVWGGRG